MWSVMWQIQGWCLGSVRIPWTSFQISEEVLKEAAQVPDAPSAKDLEGQLDLRRKITFTMGQMPKTWTAVHIKLLKNSNFGLGVHIADVSYYVKEGSALDKEALNQATTSVYVTDRSSTHVARASLNGILFFESNVDRLTQSAIMEIDPHGKVVKKHTITQTVINTTFRMTYIAMSMIS